MLANDKNKLSAFKVRVEDVRFPTTEGKEEEPRWPSLPLAGRLVAEQKRRCLSLTVFNHDNNRGLGSQGGRDVREAGV